MKQDCRTIKERLADFLAYKGIGQDKFAQLANLSRGFANNVGDSIRQSSLDKIKTAFPELNIIWLTAGIGDMLNKDETNKIQEEYFSSINTENTNTNNSIGVDYRMVPIIHIDSVGGMHSSNTIVSEPQYIEGYAPFTDAKEGDICIIQSGDSMVPTCPSGSLLLLRQVINWREYMGYGNIFVIELTDGRRITKEVTRYNEDPKDYVWCVSHNPNVPDEELPKSMIASVWKVIKIQIDKGW